jgi:four helix bundle protein
MSLATDVYAVTKVFPADERFALCDQLRRAVISIPSNIAEGSARHSPAEFRHFLGIAKGSLAEVDTQLLLAEKLGYVKDVENLAQASIILVKRINAFLAQLPSK